MPKDLTSEIFGKLLKHLSPDTDEAAVLYTRLHDSLIRFFETKGLAEPIQAADETIDRAADKINRETEIVDLTKFTFGIARYVFLEKMRRERIQVRAADMLFMRAADNGVSESGPELDSLRDCFRSLYPQEQKILVEYYANQDSSKNAEHRKRIAEREKISLNTLRIRVSRLRRRLEDCLAEKKR
jgi:DNA-directed RNA polymerase specialized sigma24 family protein